MFVLSEFKQVSDLSSDVKRVVNSEEFKQLELEPETAAAAKAKHAKYDRAIGMKWVYAGMESAVGLAALIIVLAGWRRFRAIPISLGFAAGLWWLFHAGQPDKCFRAPREWILAILGLVGAVATFVLAPSETKIIEGLRARLGLHRVDTNALKQDLLATVAAAWAGVSLPFLLRGIGTIGIGDRTRAVFFVGFCFFAFLGFLAWRREESRVAPILPRLALVAFLGFGITAACDVAARATLATYIEAKTCINPASAAALKKVQESSAKETTAARKETQTQVLAFWIAVLAAPIAEELLYRGTLQRVARRRLGGRGAMILSACIFGFAHALAFPTAFYQHFGLGLAFAAVFELAGGGAVGVVASAATHAMWNGWLATMPVFG
jgi:membrane protease YdiL (CAAX protease family)